MEDLESSPNYSKVVEWLNESALAADCEKLDTLYKVKEVVLRNESGLLSHFLSNIVAFQSDRNTEVRKFVVGFIEDIGKKHKHLLADVLPSLLFLLNDETLQVQKKVIQTACALYKEIIFWLAEESEKLATDDKIMNMWNTLVSLKTNIINMVDSDNEGVRNQTVKFMHSVILLQTPRDEDIPKQKNDVSIYDISMTMKFTKKRKLEDEAMVLFDLLVRFHTSKHISSISLMTCMGTLSNIAVLRPQFMGKVIAALESVHTHLPPSLTESQVSSVRKHLKCQLLSLLKHPTCLNYQQNVMTLLTDLGATHSEVMKTLPKEEENKKRKLKRPTNDSNNVQVINKKGRVEEQGTTESGIDETEAWVVQRLTPAFAAEIVMTTMSNLPQKMPSLFNSAYTPIAAAGTPGQIKHVSRLLAIQLHHAGLGPSDSLPLINATSSYDKDEQDSDLEEVKPKISSFTSISSKHSIRTPRALKLSEITKPLSNDTRNKLAVQAINRILKAEKVAIDGGATRSRIKIIASIATTFGLNVREAILEYILSDLKHRLDIALAWLYEEYSILQGFYKLPQILQHNQKPDHNYNTLLCSLSITAIKRCEIREKDLILSRIYLEAPLITDNALDILKEMCTECVGVLNLLQQLVIMRPAKQLLYLNILLEQTSHQNSEVHLVAIQLIVQLYERSDLRVIIEEYAAFFLGFLRLPKPPDVLFGPEKGIPTKVEMWTENISKACLQLYVALLPLNQTLIHELGKIYAECDSDIKRVILRLIEIPVSSMGMESVELLKFIEDFPTGAETLVTRALHIITDKHPPTPELVNKIRDLYQSRVSDVRFLVPVLNGLSKSEIINAFPQLIKLNPNVLKEVFNRILGTNSDGYSAISASELLIALHKIDTTKCELKYVIKATSVCFADKATFTQEVLAIVIQNLMDVTPLPTLLMRTVIQALSFYPRLIGFCMNVLQRLILKQVWKYKKVWEGFIKCCERSMPNSFQVLLQLPPPQLEDVFITSPDLKKSILEHMINLSDVQKTHIPTGILDVLYGQQNPVYHEFNNVKHEPMSPPELTIDIKEEPGIMEQI